MIIVELKPFFQALITALVIVAVSKLVSKLPST